MGTDEDLFSKIYKHQNEQGKVVEGKLRELYRQKLKIQADMGLRDQLQDEKQLSKYQRIQKLLEIRGTFLKLENQLFEKQLEEYEGLESKECEEIKV
eukprot:CAMPEP_0168616910 /NCGR_PEP_ID=MMETSP0449_2-20121227/5272_1 /TAXON_ID=1082188 /ORGANISM="Strombidium rassoulzadegani, Strain ras09" /LENGTH=96 /DNA_ID=CAMNT_0008657713 /DNA_START=481 /DNA_END=768 /DNA_ORIENTATION=-